jgi:hypothetical protein
LGWVEQLDRPRIRPVRTILLFVGRRSEVFTSGIVPGVVPDLEEKGVGLKGPRLRRR